MSNAGIRTVEWLFKEQLRVDPEWSESTPGGFRWWADQNAQTIEVVDHETGPDGKLSYLVSVRTEVLRALDLGDRERALINLSLAQFASMGGPVYDPQTKTLLLASLVRVHDGISEWMKLLISVAAILQIGEARILGPQLAQALDAEEALSSPRGGSLRPQPDEMAEMIETFIAPSGKEPTRWSSAEFQDTVNTYMRKPPALLATCGGAGFAVEFPYGNESSLCKVIADEPHPRYGNGLLVLQSFPIVGMSASQGTSLALSLNASELNERPFGYGFGSYAYRENTLYFTSFFPNVTYIGGLLPNVYLSCAHRARELSKRIVGEDWTEASYSPRRSAIGRIIDGLWGK